MKKIILIEIQIEFWERRYSSERFDSCWFNHGNLHLAAALAEMEREIIGERTRDVLQRKKANGEVYGHVPFGFKRFKGKLLSHDAEQKIVQTVLDMREKGLNFSMISRELNHMGLKTKKGNRWYPQTVKNVIAIHAAL